MTNDNYAIAKAFSMELSTKLFSEIWRRDAAMAA